MSFNKTITTSLVEQFKSAVIIALVVGISAFVLGVNYQKGSNVTADNKVVVQSTPVEVKK